MVTVPTVHSPLVESYVSWLTVDERKVSPPGSKSVTSTMVAVLGPLLVSVTVKATVSPTLGVESLTRLVRPRSAIWVLTSIDAEVDPEAAGASGKAHPYHTSAAWVSAGRESVANAIMVAFADVDRLTPTMARADGRPTFRQRTANSAR